VESPFRLLGHYHDEETGLGCTRFRYFDAEHGRWLSPDPIGLFGGKNLYGLLPSPVFATDPLGLSTKVMYYHATTKKGEANIRAKGIILSYGEQKVDFHQGFYVTTDEAQAIRWANRPENAGQGVVIAFEVDPADLAGFNTRTFPPTGDAAWEAEVIAGRQGLPAPAGVDIMEGPLLLNPKAVVDPNTGAVLGGTPQIGGQQTTFLTQPPTDVLYRGIQ
jgi:RHS repeat-associated protein